MRDLDGNGASRGANGSLRIAVVSEQIGALPGTAGGRDPAPARRVAELADVLAAAGHEVRVYARAGHGADRRSDGGRRGGATADPVPGGPARPRSQTALLEHARRFGDRLARRWRDGGWVPDLVHAHWWVGGVAAMAARRTVPVPVALTFHEVGPAHPGAPGDAQAPPDGRLALERELGCTVGLVIAQSRAELTELARLGVPRERTVLVPAGVDPGDFTPDRLLAPHRPGPHQIVAVGPAGQLDERKGFTDLIEAFRQVPDAELTILGGPDPDRLDDDPQVRRLRRLADRRRVGDRVRFAGRVPRAEMPGWYRRADLVVCASWYEPVGIAAVEAMATGVPVVATAVGGLRDTVVDGVTGVLVPPRQPATLGRALRSVLADPIRRMEYAAAGMDRARQCYAWDRVTEQLEAQYRLLIE